MEINKPLEERTIPGVTVKQLWKLGVAIVAILSFVFVMLKRISDAESVSQDNNAILKEMQQERKESERINNIRLTNIELDQREAKIRLTNLESKMSN